MLLAYNHLVINIFPRKGCVLVIFNHLVIINICVFFGAKVEIIICPLFHSKGVLRFVFVVFENDSPVVVGMWNVLFGNFYFSFFKIINENNAESLFIVSSCFCWWINIGCYTKIVLKRSSLAFPLPIDSQFFHSWNENVDCVVGGDGGVGN